MSECTSIPAASGLMTWDAAAEAGTGTGSDLSRDFLGLAGLLGLVGFLGSSFGTTMDVSGSRMRVSKPQSAASEEGYRGRWKFPNGINTTPGKPGGKSPMTRSKPLGPSFASGKMHQGNTAPDTRHQTTE